MKTTRKLLFLLIAMLAISNVCFAQSDNNVEEVVLEEETLDYSVSSSDGLPDNVTDEISVFFGNSWQCNVRCHYRLLQHRNMVDICTRTTTTTIDCIYYQANAQN